VTEVLEVSAALLEMRARAQQIGRWPSLADEGDCTDLPCGAQYPQGYAPLPGPFGYYLQMPTGLSSLQANERELVWLYLATLNGQAWRAIRREAFKSAVKAVTRPGSAFMGHAGFDGYTFDAALASVVNRGLFHLETIDGTAYLYPTIVVATAVATPPITS
jgi:hypothetical protein